MRLRVLAGLAVASAVLAGAAWWLLDREAGSDASSQGLLLPGFAARVDAVDRIDVVGAGGKVLVAIEKHDGRWRMPARGQWPANQREVGRALFRLGQARRVEAKTANPALHARLGVEAVAAADAKGAELRLAGGGEPLRLVIGNNHPALGGSYVRLGDDPQAWLLDEDVAPARDPADWLDRRLLDIPMARIDTVRVLPAGGRAFGLSRVEDRFSLDGLPPAAMHDVDIGNSTAGFTDQLPLQDLAADDGSAASRTVVFEGLDGVRITVEAWTAETGTWARLRAELDEARARAWLAKPAGAAAAAAAETTGAGTDAAIEPTAAETIPTPPAERLAALQAQVAEAQAKFEGRKFLLPAYKAQVLMRSREEFLAGDQ